MAVRSGAALRWRLAVFSLVFVFTLPIDIARLVGSHSAWPGTANVIWTCTAAYGLLVLVGVSWKKGALFFLGLLVLAGGLLALGVDIDIANSFANALLSATGVVVMGRLYFKTFGFASGNLTVL